MVIVNVPAVILAFEMVEKPGKAFAPAVNVYLSAPALKLVYGMVKLVAVVVTSGMTFTDIEGDAFTVIVATELFTELHDPNVTTAR